MNFSEIAEGAPPDKGSRLPFNPGKLLRRLCMSERVRRSAERCFIAVLIVVVLVATSAAETLSGRCIKVADGDTITILTPAKRQVKIRLACIDCPEKRQLFGKRAKQFTSFLVFGRRVRVEVIDWDRYGRAVGWVYVRDDDGREICVNRELVGAGLAWVYRRYCRSPELLKLEEEAREARRGLWQNSHPVPPWQFRWMLRR